jgi:hypothetical protein
MQARCFAINWNSMAQRPLLTNEDSTLVSVMQLPYVTLLSDLAGWSVVLPNEPTCPFVEVSIVTHCPAISDSRSADQLGSARLFMDTARI